MMLYNMDEKLLYTYVQTVQCTNLWRGDYQNNTEAQTTADCARWVAEGDCVSNPGFMFSNRRACDTSISF